MLRTNNIKPALLALLLVTACTIPVGTQSSGIEAPSLWARLTQPDAPKADAPIAAAEDATIAHDWWTKFNDPTLNTLITQALKNNKTLAIARARVEEARAARMGARSVLLPQINGTANSTRGNRGSAGFLGGKPMNMHEAGIDASWELDLFGKNQARMAEANAMLQSEDAMTQAVRVSLLAEVARTYFEYRNIEQQLALTQENLDTQKKTFDLTSDQEDGALASDFDVQRAGAQVSTTAARIPELTIARDAVLNRLSVLLGTTPGTQDALLKTKIDAAPLDKQVLVSIPASVLAERPDIRAAERQFAASIAASDAATRALFPSVNLLGFYGVQDSPFSSADPWSIGAGLVLPILNFGKFQSQIDAADARQKQAFLHYQQTVLEALEDMENALSNYLNETARNAELRRAVEQNQTAAKLARSQYTNGYSALLDVLVAERNTLDAEGALAASDAKLRQDLVSVYTAAGGGRIAPEKAVQETPKDAAKKPAAKKVEKSD